MSAAAREAVIHEHLQTLKLPAFRRGYEALARQACDGAWAYEDYLRELLEAEVCPVSTTLVHQRQLHLCIAIG